MPVSEGIDVSQHQGVLDWQRIADRDNVRFAIIKATQAQGFIDPQWEHNITGANAAGLTTGSYHYFHANRPASVQAKHYHSVAFGRHDLPPIIDFESLQGMEIDDACYRANEFILETESLWGKRVIFYSYPSFISQIFDGTRGAKDPTVRYKMKQWGSRDLWIAHYGVQNPTVPFPWKQYTIWQYDGDGGRKLEQGPDSDFNRADLSLIHDVAVITKEPVADGPTKPLWERNEGAYVPLHLRGS